MKSSTNAKGGENDSHLMQSSIRGIIFNDDSRKINPVSSAFTSA
jgi:hypothetical protein